ncbi:MAG TPA: peptide deformylase [Rickettsia endosymbiont of Ceroptres masudai]|nr:peptide deformylase [Rickettsia endosymbiont of Ceroptres masudai]
MRKIKLFVFLDIFKRKLIRTQEPNIAFSFKVTHVTQLRLKEERN